jgi:RNA polymerase sigma-70 factor (ECF subfamily)
MSRQSKRLAVEAKTSRQRTDSASPMKTPLPPADGAPLDKREARERKRRFEAEALALLDDVHAYARFLIRNPADAEDAVQECYLAALRHFETYRGPSMKAWLFTILRNSCYREMARGKRRAAPMDMSEHAETIEEAVWQAPTRTPELALSDEQDRAAVRAMVDALPDALRDTLVQREFNDLSYKEISFVSGAPIGTVMSRLARARAMLRHMALKRAA